MLLRRDDTSRWDLDLFKVDEERDFRMSRSELERLRDTVGGFDLREDSGRREDDSRDEDNSRRDDASHLSESRREEGSRRDESRREEVGRDNDSRREEMGRE